MKIVNYLEKYSDFRADSTMEYKLFEIPFKVFRRFSEKNENNF